MTKRSTQKTPALPEIEKVEVPVVDTTAAPRTSVQRIVFKQVEGEANVGRFLTVTVMGDQTVTLEVDVPAEVPSDVAAALLALESPLYVIQPVK